MRDTTAGDSVVGRMAGASSGTPYATQPVAVSAASSPPATSQKTGARVLTKNVTANIVADLIIDFCNDYGDVISNLRLQKLLYYAQAWHLALHGKELFPDRFEAWIHGPAQPEVYARFAPFTHRPIDQENRNWAVPKPIKQHIVDLMEAYGRFSSFDLERLACDEEPWREARKGLPADEPSTRAIDTATMKRFYKDKTNGEKSQDA
ncbi:MAG: DUF4065 domain-containing protein [Planctomycetes bacterium]|nr:DUF4065 domain-containing protein [Planctomycetota bacterium]